ncbi:hypothetical protein LBBP_00437 [Leptospira borgpetersenii serovar Ballum]|uniref:Uncharacterized protein n=1 Tax=Leptospira borgpetersenii serovar Ballum TaxID=280505 RepID=A0A0S2IMC7_LEPBO|nr:hypothetical protein LBBP_00437 [Leptospira borgpetersenii serovar Ballum]
MHLCKNRPLISGTIFVCPSSKKPINGFYRIRKIRFFEIILGTSVKMKFFRIQDDRRILF